MYPDVEQRSLSDIIMLLLNIYSYVFKALINLLQNKLCFFFEFLSLLGQKRLHKSDTRKLLSYLKLQCAHVCLL